MSAREQFRSILARRDGVMMPGAFDGVSAALIERAGFQTLSITGAGLSASAGFPDVGLVTMSEVLERARAVCRSTRLPVLADADTGYGSVVNVRRTVEEFERIGAAAIHLEDQAQPKKCGLLEGIEVVPTEEMVAKIRAAVDARQDPGFAIVARSDARAVESLHAVIARANAYAAAGADAIFLFDLHSADELERAAREIDAPMLTHVSRGAKVPPLHPSALARMGYAVVMFPLFALQAACWAMEDALGHLAADGTIEPWFDRSWTGTQIYELVGLREVEAFERAHAPTPSPTVPA